MGPTYKLNKIDNMRLIWLDKNIGLNGDDDNYYSMNKLCNLIENIRTFSLIETFLDYLSNELNEQTILIVSGSIGYKIIPKIHNFILIDSIYIFCQNKSKHRLWSKDFPKIQGVFNDIDFLCLHLRKSKLYHLDVKEKYFSEDTFKSLEPDYQFQQDKIDFLSNYYEEKSLSVSDMIDENLNDNIDEYLIYFSSNDTIENINLDNSVQQSKTVIPFIKQTDQKYIDNGIWPCLWWIIKNENNLSKMMSFNRIRHFIFQTKIIENIQIYFKLIENRFNDEQHFLVICDDDDNLQIYLPKICSQENVHRIYLHSSLKTFEKYEKIIKSYSKIISKLQYSNSLIHMILHDFIFYLIKLAKFYQKENKTNFAKIRYEYALHLNSILQKFIKQSFN